MTDIRHLQWYFSYPPPVPQRGSTQRQALPSLNGVLNCCVWVELLNPLTQIIKSFLCKWCECIEVLAIKILSKDNVIHPYAVIVVLAHAITQNPKVAQVHPVCRFVLDSTEQHSSCVEVVSAMVIVMQHKLALVIDVEIFIFFIFFCIAIEERNVFQTVLINISSWLHNIFFEYAT